MCGILGIIGSDGQDVRVAARALDRIRHRGPDDEGLLLADWRTGRHEAALGRDSDTRLRLPHRDTLADSGSWPLIFGHRRLSILDLSEAGHQPMSWAGGRYWITYNGEVYNYQELRTELESRGAVFHTTSDTEVILAAYEAWGACCVERFTGMWAFAIWDAGAREVFLSRDPFGIKPLYYSLAGGRLTFCSEIKGLLQCPWISRRLDGQAAYEFLAWGISENDRGDTPYADIHEMPPATRATVKLEAPPALSPEKYWNVRIGEPRRISFADAAAEFRDLFLESIRLHLRSDVPVGAALSGGIDSTSIVCAMRETGGADLALHTFSYVADDPAINEEKWMDTAGAACRAQMHKVRPDPADLESDLDTLIACQDIPFGSTSIYAQHRVFRLVKETGIKVSLDGQGPDELFAGYLHFRRDKAMSMLSRGRIGTAMSITRQQGGCSPAKLLGQFLAPRFLLKPLRKVFGRNPVPAWLDGTWLERSGAVPLYPLEELPRRDTLRHSLRRAVIDYGIPSLLRFEDRNSMHFSIESRVPFLTTKLAEAVLSLPEEHIMSDDGVTKRLLRTSFAGLVPDAILQRRDKIGFATPEAAWLSNGAERVRKVLDSPEARAMPVFRHANLLSAAGLGGGANGQHFPCWRVLNFIRWCSLTGVTFA